ncbi:MAG: hypothetical protein NVSMB30_31880 [Hymenobacter sp.]
MANEELKIGNDTEMINTAKSIIATHQAEIQQFTAFQAAHPAHTPFIPSLP